MCVRVVCVGGGGVGGVGGGVVGVWRVWGGVWGGGGGDIALFKEKQCSNFICKMVLTAKAGC